MIKVLIVEDSIVMQQLLSYIIDSDPKFHVIGIVSNGEEAIEAAEKLSPDVITMDIHMPRMDGIEATRRIMETSPTPIVIVSGSTQTKELAYSFKMMQAGALAVLLRPPGIGHPDHLREAKKLVQTLRLMSEVKVVKRSPKAIKRTAVPPPSFSSDLKAKPASRLIAIGVSTGGPPLLQKIISGLPKNFPVPILIVQHIAPGFVIGFANWLSNSCNFPIHIASHGEYLLPGHCYIAPDGFHMGVGNNSRIVLSDHPPEGGLRPSVAYLFRTVAENFGPRATGIILTGMGRDGAEELKLMKDKGAVTIVQDKESSVVHGMSGEAIKLNAASYVLSPEGIIKYLTRLVKENK